MCEVPEGFCGVEVASCLETGTAEHIVRGWSAGWGREGRITESDVQSSRSQLLDWSRLVNS